VQLELMFTPNRGLGAPWTDAHQYLYSLLWSSFLDLDAYSASRFRRRFFPYSTEFAVLELLRSIGRQVPVPKITQMGSRLGDGTTPRLSRPFVDLALWTAVPKLFGESTYGDPSRPTRCGPDDSYPGAEILRRAVADQLREDIDIEVAAFRFDADARPLLPPGLGLGIENATVEVVAGRRRATAHLSADVNVPYDAIPHDNVASDKDAPIDPTTWWIFEYWNPPSPPPELGNHGTIEMELVLPGGHSATETKWSLLKMAYTMARGPFEARVDFDCLESERQSHEESAAALFESTRAYGPPTDQDRLENGRYHAQPYAPHAIHIRRLRGYLKLEKIEGRPRWTRFVAEREGRFESPNHDRFRAETLMFWLTCDLLSFAAKYAFTGDRRA
jgi:hypothetical protein